MTRKTPSPIWPIYNVFGGTLNLAQLDSTHLAGKGCKSVIIKPLSSLSLSLSFLLRRCRWRRIVISLCVCVCLSVREHISLEPLVRSSPNLSCMSPVALARSSSGGVAMRYVGLLPVLWMTSRLAAMGRMAYFNTGGGVWCPRMPWEKMSTLLSFRR